MDASELGALSIKQLRAQCAARGMSTDGLLEKRDLVNALLAAPAMPDSTLKEAATDGTAVDGAATFECCICWQENEGPPAALPCCGVPPPGSSTVYCMRSVSYTHLTLPTTPYV